MIQFKLMKKDEEIYKKEIGNLTGKIPFIISGCAAPFSIYCLIVGFLFTDKEVLRLGFESLVLTVIMLAVGIIIVLRIRKDISKAFADCNEIQFSMELIGGNCVVINSTKNKRGVITRQDVKKLFVLKNTAILKQKNSKMLFCPKSEEIIQFLSDWIADEKKIAYRHKKTLKKTK